MASIGYNYLPIVLDFLSFEVFNMFQIPSEWSAKIYLSKDIIASNGSSLMFFDLPILRDKSNLFPHKQIYKRKIINY